MAKKRKKKKSKLSPLGREIRKSNIQCDTLNEILSIISSSESAQEKVDGIQFSILRCRSETNHLLFS